MVNKINIWVEEVAENTKCNYNNFNNNKIN
jgi:hypothetical protein